MANGSILIKNGRTVGKAGIRQEDILVIDGKIAAVGQGITAPEGVDILDAGGYLVSEGFTDIHVHLREPGFTAKETISTGTAAAAAGGYTTVCAMPNLNPVPDSIENLSIEEEAIRRQALVRVLPYCSITLGRKGLELVDMKALKDRCCGFSDDGSGVQNEGMMLKAMKMAAEENCVIAAHCEVNSLLKGGYIHDGQYCREHGHKGICSESEWEQIRRDIELSRVTGCRYHVCHISTKESVELIRKAKKDGVRITCETGPHYLYLCDMDLQEEGRFKMNPPLRSTSDREALIEGLADGTIDAIATDHAPHTAEEKSRGLEKSAMGITGLETAFPVLYTTLALTGKISPDRIFEALTEGPRKVFGLDGGLCVGKNADITIIDTETEFVIDSTRFKSMGHATPFDGMKVRGRIIKTFKDGRCVYDFNANE